MRTPSITVRLPLKEPLLKLIENWRGRQAKIPSRTEAVRELLKQALAESERAVLNRDGHR
jgi:hypothetical protein